MPPLIDNYLKHVPYVIAEVANAHNGDYDLLVKIINAVAKTGAHAIKFQWFSPDTLAMPDFEWYPVYKKLMFSEAEWDSLIDLCVSLKIDIWVDATDSSSYSRIRRHKGKIFGLKIPPSSILERQHVREVLSFQKPTLVGVGGHEDDKISDFMNYARSINPTLIIQHGFQGYPTRPEDATLSRLNFLKNKYFLPVAYADHEEAGTDLSFQMPLFAYFSGAEILEKHICFDRSTKPYDYYSSLEPEEFSSLVSELAKAKNIMGGIEITEAQKKYLTVASRALSISNIKLGQYILPEHIIYRRTSVQDAITPDISEKLIPGVALREILSLDPLKCGDIRKVKIVAVVPCRLGSSRLEKKAFAEIAGLPSIKRCIINTKQISFVDEVVLATSDNIVDDELVDYAKAENIKYVRGSEKNVLERIIKAGREYSADIVLRITGDCPVISFEMMEFMILDHLRKDADMSYSHSNIAVGTIGDVYKFSALERLYEIVPNAEYSEYLSYYFINNQNAFNVNDVSLPNIWQKPEWRLTLDEPADLTLLDRIVSYYNLGEEPISFRQIENYFLKFPEDVQINQGAKLKYKTDMRFIEHLNKSTSFDTIKLKEGY